MELGLTAGWGCCPGGKGLPVEGLVKLEKYLPFRVGLAFQGMGLDCRLRLVPWGGLKSGGALMS